MPATPKSTNNKNVAARIMLLVITHMKAEPRMTTARMQNITKFAIIYLLGFSVKLTDF